MERQSLVLGLPQEASPLRLVAPREGLPPPTFPPQPKGSWADTVLSISHSQRGKTGSGTMPGHAGQTGDRRRREASGGKPSLPVWRRARLPLRTSWGWGRLRPATQLLFVLLLLGCFPKQTDQGGKMKGICRRRTCPSQVARPWDSQHSSMEVSC
jgi:hypothetical protein